MKRWWTRMVVVGMMLFMLTGCIASQTETTINADGTGTNTLKIGMEASAMAMMASMGDTGGGNPFESVKDDTADLPAEWEVVTSDWKEKLGDQNFEGVQVAMKFKNVATLNEQLVELGNQSGSGDNPAGGILANLKVEETADGFIVTGTGNSTNLAESGATSGMGDSADALKNAVLVWKVTMPGEITEYEPKEIATVAGNTITWRFPADRTATFDLRAVSTKSGGGSLPLILGIVGGLLVLGGLAFFLMNRRKTAVAVPAAPYAQPGAYNPNAQYGQQGGYGQQPGSYDPNAQYGQQPGSYDANAQYGQQPGGGSGQQPGSTDPNDPTRR